MSAMRAVHHPRAPLSEELRHFTRETAVQVRHYHETIPGYTVTPLVSLTALAKELGVAGIHIKDESHRFGLNAFKGLGGSYSAGRYLASRLGIPPEELSFPAITAPAAKESLGEITFVTATDGNHGRGVAWIANQLGQKSVVYMPKGSAVERLENIRAQGADASITEFYYDDTVRHAKTQAEKNGWVLVQDTAWDGYREIPMWIMQGYTTMALEAAEQLGDTIPTHVFLQAGVGSMAGALAAFFRSYYGENAPKVVLVEADKADCFYETAKANDGTLHCVGGPLDTIMAGLACGEPCSIAWELLDGCCDCFVSMSDDCAARGMRILAAPLPGDTAVVSGESGASGFGCAADILRQPSMAALKAELELDDTSVILCFSTEGATDKENYRRIVWDGAYS